MQTNEYNSPPIVNLINCTNHSHPPPYWRIYASVNRVSMGLGNSLSSVRRQAITATNADLLSIRLLGTNFSEIRIRILSFSFKKIQLKFSAPKTAAILPRGRWVNLVQLLSGFPWDRLSVTTRIRKRISFPFCYMLLFHRITIILFMMIHW